MSNQFLKASKILTAIFALTLLWPNQYSPISLVVLFLALFQNLVFMFFSVAYFGLLAYFFYSGIKKINNIWDNLITIIAIWASYVTIALGIEHLLSNNNTVYLTFLLLYLLSSLSAVILTIQQAYQRVRGNDK